MESTIDSLFIFLEVDGVVRCAGSGRCWVNSPILTFGLKYRRFNNGGTLTIASTIGDKESIALNNLQYYIITFIFNYLIA